MRLPRVRFTVGKLAFAVVVIAANCGVLRLLYDRVETIVGNPPPADRAFAGSLVVLNVALLGTLILGAGRLRSFCCHGPRVARPILAGATFLQLHFLALLTIATIYRPDALDGYLQKLAPSLNDDFACGLRFQMHAHAHTFLALWCPILGLVISGPQLLLSWAGSIFANRSAATLTRRRFRVLTGLVSLAFACVALAIAVGPRPFVDEQEVALVFEVVDKESGRPIRAAFLRIPDAFNSTSLPPRALTGSDGRARVTCRFEVNGVRSAFQRIGTYSAWGRWLEIDATGYQRLRTSLPEVLGDSLDPDRPLVATVALARGNTRDNSFRKIAGTYVLAALPEWRISPFEILPDGRFTSRVHGRCLMPCEYGYLKLNRGELEPIPIPHPGRELCLSNTSPYRIIEWGDCLFLSSANDQALRAFCRESLAAKCSPNYRKTNGAHIRWQDSQKLPAGLPRMPWNVWVSFLLDEITCKNDEGILRLSIKSVGTRE
jgi:hypothetical protein